ncbi:Imm12 family immunity protein [Bacteroides fragilis]
MEFTLNIVYGGELNASKALSPFVRNMRKIIKDTFTSFENEAVTMFKVTLFFDGDISSYYNGTGIYQPRYYNVKKEYVVSFALTGHNGLGIRKKI